jgi:hypothetical protein
VILSIVIRLLLVRLDLVALIWGIANLALFRSQWRLVVVAMRIIRGDPFKGDALTVQLSAAEIAESAGDCRAPALILTRESPRWRRRAKLTGRGERHS